MTEKLPQSVAPADVRASDPEREEVATLLREAATTGRLTMPEADERLAAAYAAVTRGELATLTTDLPVAAAERPVEAVDRAGLTPRARRRLAVHAAIVAIMTINLVVRFALSGAPFFWPLFPMTFLLGSLAVHYALARRGGFPIQALSRGTSAA